MRPPGAEDGGPGHLGVSALVGARAPADPPADHHGAQTALGGVVVRQRLGFGDEDEEVPVSSTGQALDVLRYPSAQLGLKSRRVILERLTEGQQAAFQGQLGGATLFP